MPKTAEPTTKKKTTEPAAKKATASAKPVAPAAAAPKTTKVPPRKADGPTITMKVGEAAVVAEARAALGMPWHNDLGSRRFHEMRRESHIFKKTLTPEEQRVHARKVFEYESEIERLADKAKAQKTFVDAELVGSEPVRMRACEREKEFRTALLACERKRADLLRDYHLDAAADGYIWIDVECVIFADDVDQETCLARADTGEVIWRRRMTDADHLARKKRLQLELSGTNAQSA